MEQYLINNIYHTYALQSVAIGPDGRFRIQYDAKVTTSRLRTVPHTYSGKTPLFLLSPGMGCHSHMCTYHTQQKVFNYYGSKHIFISSKEKVIV